jgi:oligoendopeptidase F
MSYPTINPTDWSTVQPHVDALLAAELTPANANAWLQQWSDLASVLYEAQAQVNRKVTENTADEEADRQFLILVEQIMPQARVANQALRDKLLTLQAHGHTPEPDTIELLRRFRAEADIYCAENVPILSELMKLGNQFEKVMGGLNVEWNGAIETIPQARLHWQSQDRTEREKSWRLVMAAFLAQREKLNALYLQMLGQRRQVAKNADEPHFRAYKWQELARFDYTPADCVTFHDAIEHEVVPLAQKIYAEQADSLGLAALRPWDTDVDPHGEPLLQPGGSGAGRALRCHARRLPRPALTCQQRRRRLLRRLPGDRQAVHLHERCGHTRRRPNLAARGRACLPLHGIAAQPAVVEPERADGILRGRIDGHGTAGCAIPAVRAGRLL